MEVGDKIVCINNISIFGDILTLTVGKTYIIKNFDLAMGRDYIYVVNDDEYEHSYKIKRFISIKEYRKMKLNHLNNISR